MRRSGAALLFALAASLGYPLHSTRLALSMPQLRTAMPNGPGGQAKPRRIKASNRSASRRISAAEAKRRSIKRRNCLRHKARVRS